jgi:hypothetical protein
MFRKCRSVLLGLLWPLAITGCGLGSTTADLFPIEGPLSKRTPVPSIRANVDGILGNTGTLRVALPDNEDCSGRWSSAAPTYTAATSGSLWSIHGSAAFSGHTAAIAPGVNRGEFFVTCAKGTTISGEFFTGSGTANGYGVAKDSKGNVYKVLF